MDKRKGGNASVAKYAHLLYTKTNKTIQIQDHKTTIIESTVHVEVQFSTAVA